MTLPVPQGAGPHLLHWHIMSQVRQGPGRAGHRAALPLLWPGHESSFCRQPHERQAGRWRPSPGPSPATREQPCSKEGTFFYSAQLPPCAEQAPSWIKAPQMQCGLWEPMLGPCPICRTLFWPEGSQHMGRVGGVSRRPSPFMTAPREPRTPATILPSSIFSAVGTGSLSQLQLSPS